MVWVLLVLNVKCNEGKNAMSVCKILALLFIVNSHAVFADVSNNRQFTPYYMAMPAAQNIDKNANQSVSVQNQKSGILGYAQGEAGKIFLDYENLFLTQSVFYLGSAIGVAAVLANSSYDEKIREYYSDNIRQDSLNNVETVTYLMGAHWKVLPVLGGAAVVGKIFEKSPAGATMYSWGERSLRGFILGAPIMAVLQVGTGASRPKEVDDQGSRWNPFNDNNGASGHTFVGAIPFLTAAAMAENIFLKSAFFLGSFLSGWGRIYLDRHYFSQVFLGWSVAYLSVESVNQTESKIKNIQLAPVILQNGYGAGVNIKF